LKCFRVISYLEKVTIKVLSAYVRDDAGIKSSASFVWSLVVDEERKRPCHWVGLVLCALTLMAKWQEVKMVRKNPFSIIPEVLFQSRWNQLT